MSLKLSHVAGAERVPGRLRGISVVREAPPHTAPVRREYGNTGCIGGEQDPAYNFAIANGVPANADYPYKYGCPHAWLASATRLA